LVIKDWGRSLKFGDIKSYVEFAICGGLQILIILYVVFVVSKWIFDQYG